MGKIWIILTYYTIVSSELTGNYICVVNESYLQNITEPYKRNITVRNYRWCLTMPPRCSFYTMKEVLDTRVVQKNLTRVIPKCCPGYKEDMSGEKCISECEHCVQGKCVNAICNCEAGYSGRNCDKACDETHWGTNCSSRCVCERGSCNPVTGNCICPSGWSGIKCDQPCKFNRFGPNCTETCACKENELCNNIDGECVRKSTTVASNPTDVKFNTQTILYTNGYNHVNVTLPVSSITKTPTLQKYHTLYTTITTEKPSLFTTNTNFITKINVNSNGKFSINTVDVKDLNMHQQSKTGHNNEIKQVPALTSFTEVTRSIPTNYKTSPDNIYNKSNMDLTTVKSKKEYREDILVTMKTPKEANYEVTTISKKKSVSKKKYYENDNKDDNYLSDEAQDDDIVHRGKNLNANNISIGTFITVCILALILLIVLIRQKRKKNKKQKTASEEQKSCGSQTVSVYTHTVFHAPVQDLKDYVYDHPPTTGSYRSTSAPEPPDIPFIDSGISNRTSEPIYDEISNKDTLPLNTTSDDSETALYVNTFGKTRF